MSYLNMQLISQMTSTNADVLLILKFNEYPTANPVVNQYEGLFKLQVIERFIQTRQVYNSLKHEM